MPRKIAGTVRILRNDDGELQWHGKWTRADGTRSGWIPIPPAGSPPIALGDEAAAKACAAGLAPKIRARKRREPPRGRGRDGREIRGALVHLA